jgi:shikimate dehydrogenase
MRPPIDKHTQLCVSIAARPSNFGSSLHNAAYQALGLNFVYKACQVSDLAGAIAGVRALGIRGCSVSMPFKEKVLSFLDDLDDTAKVIGAVNTIVNQNGRLIGYNTDAVGAEMALEILKASPDESVLLLGAGGVARAILYALRQLGFKNVTVANRNLDRIEALQDILPCTPMEWAERQRDRFNLLINATSIGMNPEPDVMPVEDVMIRSARAVMDVVVSPLETQLIRQAQAAGKQTSPGSLMSLGQAMAQFTLYTGQPAPRQAMEQALREMK